MSNFLTTDAHAKAAVSQEATRQQVADRTNPARAKLENKVGKNFNNICNYIPSCNFLQGYKYEAKEGCM